MKVDFHIDLYKVKHSIAGRNDKPTMKMEWFTYLEERFHPQNIT